MIPTLLGMQPGLDVSNSEQTLEIEQTVEKREVPRDPWGMMQRVYGLRNILLWPGQFAMLDFFKVVTVLCVLLSAFSLLRLFHLFSH